MKRFNFVIKEKKEIERKIWIQKETYIRTKESAWMSLKNEANYPLKKNLPIF